MKRKIKNYQKVILSKGQLLTYFLQGFLAETVILYLFYNSLLLPFLLSPCAVFYVRYKKKQMAVQQCRELNIQFREGIQAVAAAMNAGYSVENSFAEAVRDLQLIYSAKTDIMQEFEHITVQLKRNRTVEELLKDLADRSQVEDINDFTEVFITAKRSGGSLHKIIHGTVQNISAKLEIKREIETLISGKKMEARIMSLIPLGIILYMKISSPGFLNCLYHNFTGAAIMTAALLLYGGAFYLSEKIVAIQV